MHVYNRPDSFVHAVIFWLATPTLLVLLVKASKTGSTSALNADVKGGWELGMFTVEACLIEGGAVSSLKGFDCSH